MKYKLVQRPNPIDKTKEKMYYASVVNTGKINQRSIAKEIAGRSSLTIGDVSNVIENFLELIPNHLMDGKSVELGYFGIFRITISSDGSVEENDFTHNKIKKLKVSFRPSTEFKRMIEGTHFEKEK